MFRVFTLFPRRFYSHSWGGVCLHFTRWWQWGKRCFFVRTTEFVRPTFSTWNQIQYRVKMNDKDAILIQQLLEVAMKNRENWLIPQEIYDKIVKQAN